MSHLCAGQHALRKLVYRDRALGNEFFERVRNFDARRRNADTKFTDNSGVVGEH